MNSRCRLCSNINTDLIPVLNNSDLPSKIFKLFQITITFEDRLPTCVCSLCFKLVQDIWSSYVIVQKAQEHLLEILNNVRKNDVKPDISISASLKIEDNEFGNNPVDLVKNEEKRNSKKIKLNRKKRELSEITLIELKEDGSCVPKTELFGWESYPWVCQDCHRMCTSPQELRDHHATIHEQAPKYSCINCNKTYTKYSTFLIHVRNHQTELKFCCDVCFKWYPTIENLEKHEHEHKEENRYVCPTCSKSFKTKSSFTMHTRSHLPDNVKNRYQCDLCPKRFGTKPNLMVHKRIHLGVKEYTCDQCGKSFFQKGNLDNHLLTHTAERPFFCSICNKTFKTQIRLKKHLSVHSGLKPHKCDVCGKQFRERGTLKEHSRIHTGAMPFTCEFCGKSFRFKGILTTHLRLHTGERPYSCEECQHHFTNWPNYNKHMKRRHGINTSVSVRKPQTIPPTGMPHRNPPGTVLAQPIVVTEMQNETYIEENENNYFPVLGLYNIQDNMLQQQRVQ